MKLLNKHNILLFILTISMVSCQLDVTQNGSITGNKKVRTEERPIPETYSKLEVQEGITVYLSMNSDEKITVEADENLLKVIKTEIKGGVLKIYSDPNIKKAKARNVYISTAHINEIESSSGSSVISENTLINTNMTINSSSGSSIRLQINTTNLISKSSSGSQIKLNGKTTNLTISASSGSSINAYGLTAKEVVSKASSGSHIEVTATQNLTGKSSSGGSIHYKGNPKHIDKKTSSGGNVSAG